MSKIVTRIAPSPTGKLHFATARAALFNYLYAKQHDGKFILRLEDTDKARSTKEFAEDIVEQLNWLGLVPDEMHTQSEYVGEHTKELQRLIAQDKAYVSQEPSKDDPQKMVSVVRLRNPGTVITFEDLIRGAIETDTTDLGDFVIARSIDDPLFHFVVVVDDYRMGVTHVIRGEDHISNTPRQILIAQALGYSLPHYAHLPIILSPDGKGKMSKRKGDVAIASFRERGFLPEAVINYVALLGWRKDGETEHFTMDDLRKNFSLEGIQKGGAAHNEEKLRALNRHYITQQPDEVFVREFSTRTNIVSNEPLIRAVPLLRERISVWEDITAQVTNGEWDWLLHAPQCEPRTLLGKHNTSESAMKHLEHIITTLNGVADSQWNAASIKDTVWDYAEQQGRGAVLWPMRFALTGKEKSPDPFSVAYVLGKTESIQRLTNALNAL